MSEEQQVDNVATQEANGPTEQESNDDKVAYATYSKVMGTLKKRENELNEYKAKLQDIELSKKQAEGNKDEVINTLRNQLKEAQEQSTKLKHQYGWSTLEGQIKSQAVKAGCVNPDKLIRLLDEDDLRGIEVDEKFRVNNDDLSRLLEKAKKDHSDIGLFKSKKVNVNDVAPSTIPTKSKKVEEMSAAELAEYIKKME